MINNLGKKIYYRTEARKRLPEILNKVMDSGTAVYIAERGVNQAVVLSVAEYQKLTKDIKKKSLADSGFFGMWKDRKDLKNSVKWVNDMRKAEEKRHLRDA